MNAIAPARPVSQATAHHLRALQRLVELGMELAELAAHQARTEATTPAPEPAPAPQPRPARTLAPSPAPEPEPEPAPRRHPDPFLAFARLSRAVCQAVNLHTAIEAGPAHAHAARAPADPRRAPIRQAILHATDNHPDRAELRRSAERRLDHELAADPRAETPVAQLLAAICQDLGVTPDYAHLPDDLLDALAEASDADPPPDHPDPDEPELDRFLAYARRAVT